MKRKEVKVEKKNRKMKENAIMEMCEELNIEFHKKGHCYSSILFLSIFISIRKCHNSVQVITLQLPPIIRRHVTYTSLTYW